MCVSEFCFAVLGGFHIWLPVDLPPQLTANQFIPAGHILADLALTFRKVIDPYAFPQRVIPSRDSAACGDSRGVRQSKPTMISTPYSSTLANVS